jgi:pyruvate dehydrogenase E2 component (dihydrolipoamide acetyltransferase)
MALVDVKVPDIGDFKDVAVIEVLVKVGDVIRAEQSLVTVESDKASMEIPSSHAGTVKAVQVKVGDKINEGNVVVQLEVAGAGAAAPSATPAAAPAAAAVAAASVTAAPVAAAPVIATPVAAAPAVAAASASVGTVQVRVPDIGDFKDVAVIEVMVRVGDTVKAEQSLITVESDKASMEIPSSHAGVVQSIAIKVGDKVNQGDVVVVLQGAAGAPGPAAAAAPVADAQPAASAVSAPQAATNVVAPSSASAPTAAAVPAHDPTVAPTGKLPHASPAVRKFARELGVPLAEVKGSAPKGRITLDDVQVFTRAVMAGSAQTAAQAAKAPKAAASGADGAALGLLPWPKVDFAKFGPVTRKPVPRIKKISGANLHRNWVMIPHVTNHDDADITELEAFRVQVNKENEKSGAKLTMLAFLIKASVSVLKKYPEFNASLDGDELVFKDYWHIGFAADTPNGLMVPVIKNADQKGIFAISKEMSELAAKAREGKLGPADMQGATFSISSLGGIGGRYFSPIINAPEVAILGVSKSSMQPVWDGKAFQPRLMLPMSLSWDHRVIDGASAARFNAAMGQILADFRRVLL